MDARKLQRILEDQGYTWKYTGSNHIRWMDRDGRTVSTFAGSPSDHRSLKNFIGEMRKAGAQIPGKDGKLVTRRRREAR